MKWDGEHLTVQKMLGGLRDNLTLTLARNPGCLGGSASSGIGNQTPQA